MLIASWPRAALAPGAGSSGLVQRPLSILTSQWCLLTPTPACLLAQDLPESSFQLPVHLPPAPGGNVTPGQAPRVPLPLAPDLEAQASGVLLVTILLTRWPLGLGSLSHLCCALCLTGGPPTARRFPGSSPELSTGREWLLQFNLMETKSHEKFQFLSCTKPS